MQDTNSILSPIYYVDKNNLLGEGVYGKVYRCYNVNDKNKI